MPDRRDGDKHERFTAYPDAYFLVLNLGS